MNFKDKNILITGISGFVGSYLAKKLINMGSNVYGLIRIRSDNSKPKNFTDHLIQNDIIPIYGDLSDINSLKNALDISKPDYIFHLAAQSFVPRSFENPVETQQINCVGTSNLLEAVRLNESDSKIIFAGSSEEYGLVISSEKQYSSAKNSYGSIFPEPEIIPELPINENSPLRPMSPYAVSKVFGDYLMRNYYHSYGLNTIVSRAFNHEGAGRGSMFVTSVITKQVMELKLKEKYHIEIGNINAFRDWSHINDIIDGYLLLASKGKSGEVYNQGSMRTNSVLSYILLSLNESGWDIDKIETFEGNKIVKNPLELDNSTLFGIKFEKTNIDRIMLEEGLEYTKKDKGIIVHTDKGNLKIHFNQKLFRPAEVPILLSDTTKINKIGFKFAHSVNDIIRDQLDYFKKKSNRE